MKFPTIETRRLFLRAPNARDLEWAFTRLSGWECLATAPLAGRQAFRQMHVLLTHWQLSGFGMFAVLPEGADTPMGLVGPWQPSGWPEPEIGWLVWRRSDDAIELTAEAVNATVHHASGMLGWREAASFLCPSDGRSLAVAELTGALADPFADRAGAIAWRYPATPLPRAA
ncbi:MAG: GNAT family N-acetyltransferase [Pseudomonadota bacterium]